MANGPVKGESSYDKICKHLRYTQDFHDLTQQIFERLAKANIAGWKFRPGGYYGADDPSKRRNVAPPECEFLVDWGKNSDGSDRLQSVYAARFNEFLIKLEEIVPDDEIEDLARKLFGTPKCPSYFCKLNKLLGRDEKGERKDKLPNRWLEYAQHAIAEHLAGMISRTQEKLREAMRQAILSPEFAAERVHFHELCIAEEIKAVLLKFSSVAKPHVLKMALDEFVAHEIMES
ncbi:MAG: hypothetical protein ACRD6W_00705 [Nitrososphaerales archaeon]